jgi:hypothetical protein
VPVDLRAQLAQGQHGERGRADAVDVVVAVDADPLAALDRPPDPGDRDGSVAQEVRIVTR